MKKQSMPSSFLTEKGFQLAEIVSTLPKGQLDEYAASGEMVCQIAHLLTGSRARSAEMARLNLMGKNDKYAIGAIGPVAAVAAHAIQGRDAEVVTLEGDVHVMTPGGTLREEHKTGFMVDVAKAGVGFAFSHSQHIAAAPPAVKLLGFNITSHVGVARAFHVTTTSWVVSMFCTNKNPFNRTKMLYHPASRGAAAKLFADDPETTVSTDFTQYFYGTQG